MKHVFLSTCAINKTMALVKAPPDVSKSALTPIILAASLDRSGSMGNATGEIKDDKDTTRWQVVVDCLGQAIDYRRNNGHPDDILLVIAFSTNAEVFVKPIKLRDWNENNFATLMAVQPTGYTNISGGDYMVSSEINKYLATLDEHSIKPIVVTLNLTDGTANAGITNPKHIAAAKHNQTRALVDAGYLTVSGFYAVGDGANPAVSRKCAKGSNTTLWKHIKSDDFAEFSGEIGLLTSLSQLVTSVKLKDEVVIVLKDSWCPLTLSGSMKDLVIPVPLLGTLLTKCLQQSHHHHIKSDEKEYNFVVDVYMLESVKEYFVGCGVGCGVGGDDDEKYKKKEEEVEHSFRTELSVLAEEQRKNFLDRLANECDTFTKIFTQMHGADEYSKVVLALVMVIDNYKTTLESKEMDFTAVCGGDVGLLRQMSSMSQAACTMSVDFEKRYNKRYKKRASTVGADGAANSGMVSTLPLPMHRSVVLDLPVSLLLPETSISHQEEEKQSCQVVRRRVRKRRSSKYNN